MRDWLHINDGSWSKFFDPDVVNFLLFGLGRLSHLWFEFGKFSRKNPKVFNFFPFESKKFCRIGLKNIWVKDKLASYLPSVKSMLRSGQGPSLLQILQCLFVPPTLTPQYKTIQYNMRYPPKRSEASGTKILPHAWIYLSVSFLMQQKWPRGFLKFCLGAELWGPRGCTRYNGMV